MKIFEQDLLDDEGQAIGKMAIFVGGVGERNPKKSIDKAVFDYVKDLPHNQFVDISLDNPYTRVVTTSLLELPLRDFQETDRIGR